MDNNNSKGSLIKGHGHFKEYEAEERPLRGKGGPVSQGSEGGDTEGGSLCLREEAQGSGAGDPAPSA